MLFVFVLLSIILCPFFLKRKRKLIALLLLSNRSIVSINVPSLFLTVSWACLQCVIVVFPDHTHLLFVLLSLLKRQECDLMRFFIVSVFSVAYVSMINDVARTLKKLRTSKGDY